MIDIRKEDLITLPEVAEFFDVCINSVKSWAAKGELETVFAGRTPKTSWEAVNRYVNRRNERPEVVKPERKIRKATSKQHSASAARGKAGLVGRHGMKA